MAEDKKFELNDIKFNVLVCIKCGESKISPEACEMCPKCFSAMIKGEKPPSHEFCESCGSKYSISERAVKLKDVLWGEQQARILTLLSLQKLCAKCLRKVLAGPTEKYYAADKITLKPHFRQQHPRPDEDSYGRKLPPPGNPAHPKKFT